MSNNEHPFTAPPELVDDLNRAVLHGNSSVPNALRAAFCAGADRELEACVKWLDEVGPSAIPLWGNDLRKDRRPKPPSLKEQGRQALERISNSVVMETGGAELDVLKAIVESLPD